MGKSKKAEKVKTEPTADEALSGPIPKSLRKKHRQGISTFIPVGEVFRDINGERVILTSEFFGNPDNAEAVKKVEKQAKRLDHPLAHIRDPLDPILVEVSDDGTFTLLHGVTSLRAYGRQSSKFAGFAPVVVAYPDDHETLDTSTMTPTQDLFLELLAARDRAGDRVFTYDKRHAKVAKELAEMGLVAYDGGPVQGSIRANLTLKGQLAMLKPGYISNAEYFAREKKAKIKLYEKFERASKDGKKHERKAAKKRKGKR